MDVQSDAEFNKSTVFVRNVGFDVADSELQELFSEIGPVRSCFLVKHKDSSKHKGFGFVQYALSEDAAKAVDQLNLTDLKGRKLKVESAIRRATFQERLNKKNADAPGTTATEQATTAVKAKAKQVALRSKGKQIKPDAQRLVRTVAVGVSSEAFLEVASTAAQSAGQVEKVERCSPKEETIQKGFTDDGCPAHILLVTYTSVKTALVAVSKLHGLEVGSLQTAAQGEVERTVLWARQVSGEGLHLKKNRVIVRNVPFTVSEEDLRKFFTPAGFVWAVSLPKSEGGKLRGFAFICFCTHAEAAKAIAQCNGQVLKGRTLAVDWALGKTQYTRSAAATMAGDEVLAPARPEFDFGRMDSSTGSEELQAEDQENPSAEEEQVILKSIVNDIVETKAVQEANPSGSGEVLADDFPRPRTAKGNDGEAPGTSTTPSSCREPPKATVFVRGLPLKATKEEVEDRLSAFGQLRACRLVRNKATGKFNGTAFVEYAGEQSAKSAAQACQDARAGKGTGVAILGKLVDIDIALSQEEARSLGARTNPGLQLPKDTYNSALLAKEGTIQEGSGAWEAMSAGDRAKRKRALEEKNMKLRSPNFFVSPTRLSIRNIPPSVDEKALKQLLLGAVKARAVKEQPKVKQVKLLRDPSRLGADGQPKSRGLGFVEFVKHDHAVAALRHLNNNPDVFGAERRPIVEFALENVQALKKHSARVIHSQKKAGQQAVSSEGNGDAEEGITNEQAQQQKVRGSKRTRSSRVQHEDTTEVSARKRAKLAEPGLHRAPDKTAGQKTKKRDTVMAPHQPVLTRSSQPSQNALSRGLEKKRGSQAKKKQKVQDPEDRFELLVNSYKKKLFQQGSAGRKPAAQGRWFE